jgi:anti-anti-sigma factor
MIDDVNVVRPRAGSAVVELRGEHDLATAHELHELLSSLIVDNELVVVDVTAAEFVDSAVLFCLVRASRQSEERGSRFCLQVGTTPIVRAALEITGLLDVLDWASSRDELLAEVSEREGTG